MINWRYYNAALHQERQIATIEALREIAEQLEVIAKALKLLHIMKHDKEG